MFLDMGSIATFDLSQLECAKVDLIQYFDFFLSHIHRGRGFEKSGKILFVNAAMVNHQRKLVHKPFYVELDLKSRSVSMIEEKDL